MRHSLDYLFEKKQKDFYNSLNNINTIALAKIVEIDNSILEADIQLISFIDFNGEYVDSSRIYSVPIMPVFNSSSFFINAPYQVNDLVVVGFCQHSLEGTIDISEQTEPSSKDKYSFDDAIILGNITAKYIDQYPDDLSILHKKTGNYIRFTHEGNIEITGNTQINGNLVVTGTGLFNDLLKSEEDVQSNSISLVNHTHGNVQSGSNDTGGPK